ncbi:exodeoxyribonuclease VII small subunit [Serpentinicella sp. ANB-PHB4]|uniref:exodeoxyribonuclease VII small subunit n=1 Tax=Serpentinicella sp. ANB-PHB4 TaxID=3074076 RepID=UPI00285D6A56|nr:exodeoxyribonuclease VII small subunit [Serpentinicella sp. ANB-PHB4]MDR5658188.1 exodeoxyribonuclease VII small subunit [Serpentinicella sp. ANB-PHB4]
MTKKMDYEKSLNQLEKVIEQLENKELSLDDALLLFQEGIELYRLCHSKLNEVEHKISLIIDENKELTETPLTLDELEE